MYAGRTADEHVPYAADLFARFSAVAAGAFTLAAALQLTTLHQHTTLHRSTLHRSTTLHTVNLRNVYACSPATAVREADACLLRRK